MKNINKLIILTSILLMSACTEDSFSTFNNKPSLYFRLSTTDTNLDSLYFSFLITLENSYDVKIPVQLLGKAYDEDKTYKIKILPTSTAVEGLHYEPFNDIQVFPANTYVTNLPIKVLNTDPDLENTSVSLNLLIEPNDNFDLGEYKRITVKVLISNLIMKPAAWEHSYGVMTFGPYSKVKHRIYVSMFGEFPSIEALTADYNYFKYVQAVKLKQYLYENYPVYDENNQIISYTW